MSNLTNQTCEACEIGAPLVSESDQAKLLEGLDGWEIDNIPKPTYEEDYYEVVLSQAHLQQSSSQYQNIFL